MKAIIRRLSTFSGCFFYCTFEGLRHSIQGAGKMPEEPKTDPVKDQTQDATKKDSPDTPAVDVKDLFAKLDPEMLSKLIDEREDLKKWSESFTDRRVTQAVTTRDEIWLKDKIPKLKEEWSAKIREEILPEETPAEKAQKEMQKQINAMAVQLKREQNEKFAIQYANSHGLEDVAYLVKNMNLESETQIKQVFDNYGAQLKFAYDKGRNSILKNKGKTPETGDDGNHQFNNLSEYKIYLEQHPNEYDFKVYSELAARQR